MPTELPLESFWDLVEKSGVIREEELHPLREEYSRDYEQLDTASKVADDLVARGLLTRWQANMLLQGRHKGFFLGPYRLLDILGKGGMGSVYLAEHQLMRRRAAVKVLPSKQISRRPSLIERFRREAQAVAAMDHPNIVRAYEFNKEMLDKTDVHYLAMEFVRGQDLQELVEKEGVLDYVRAADFIRQAALGLAHAHEAGLVHRDIKPANLLIDEKGVVKILDLGLVKSFEDSDEASLTGEHENTVLGTADYLAPEQAVSSRDVDARADIYSLGYTFYYALTRHPPFPEGTIHQRMAAHQSRHADPMVNDRPDVRSDLVAIHDKMVAKHPVDRYPTANAVAEAISNWLFQHADEDWILEHPGLLGDRPDHGLLNGREPTHAMSGSSDETELDLLPLEDETRNPSSVSKRESLSKEPADERTDTQPEQEESTKRDTKEGEKPVGARTVADSLLPSLERDPISRLLETEPTNTGNRPLAPIDRLASFWSIEGMAQRLQVPPVVVVIILALLVLLIGVVGFLAIGNLGLGKGAALDPSPYVLRDTFFSCVDRFASIPCRLVHFVFRP